MGKRKRVNGQAENGIEEFNAKASKLTFNSYEDIPDSEDEFHINRDKVFLDNGPQAKRRKQLEQQDDFLEPSDEEVLVYSDSVSEDGAEDDYKENMKPDPGEGQESDEEGSVDQGSGDEINGWGDNRADYYNADVIETEQDALDEEIEARRIQQKRLRALKEADFGFDEREWQDLGNADGGADGDGGGGVYTEVLPQLQITNDMNSVQRLKLLNTRYPEFEPLVMELLELQPLHEELSLTAKDVQDTPMGNIKWQALSAYLGSLAMYFALFTSTAKTDRADSFPLAPVELRNHAVMESLVKCRDTWAKVKDMEIPSPSNDTIAGVASDPEVDDVAVIADSDPGSSDNDTEPLVMQAETGLHPDTVASLARRAARLRQTEESLASISALTTDTSLHHIRRPAAEIQKAAILEPNDLDSDIGDETALAPHEAAEKARRKKSLRFYTSQIAQKANKRASAGRAAGGDDDLPYRERLRDRQERLVREAEKKGRKGMGKLGDGLGGEEEDVEVTNREREEGDEIGDEYSRELEGRVRAKKDEKLRREDAYVQAREEGGMVVRREANKVGLDGRREIGFAIEKNKGMTPRRKKENRNPRVKKKKQYEDKQKKLKSMKPMYKGGEGRGGYGGELTGIKKGLVRSVKL